MNTNKEIEFQNKHLEVKNIFLEIAKSCKTKDATYLKELNISYHISELINAFNNPVNINQKNYDLIIDLYGFLKPLWYELMDAFQDFKDKDYDLSIDPIVLELRSCRDYFYGIYDTFSEDFEEQSKLIKSISELDADTKETPQEIINKVEIKKVYNTRLNTKEKYFLKEKDVAEKIVSIDKPALNNGKAKFSNDNQFSALQWGTIFYYADESKLLSDEITLKGRKKTFLKNHNNPTTLNNLKTKYYEAKKRINERKNYPIDKLEAIIPFLKEKYKQTVTKVESDITFLKEESVDK